MSALLAAWLTLVGALLLAVQARTHFPFGAPLGADYQPHPPALLGALALAVIVVAGVGRARGALRLPDRWFAPAHPYRRYLLALALASALTLALFPDVSLLQVSYFAALGVLLGIAVLAAPTRFYLGRPGSDVGGDLRRLWRSRYLVWLWLQHNIESRYAQHVLGVLWIALLPVSTALVLSLAFSQFMRVQLDVPFIAFYLSALVHYNLFANGVSRAGVVITDKLTLIAQVYFPREVLVVVAFGELLVDFAFTFLAMLIINALVGVLPNPYYLLLPPLWLLLLILVLGMMLLISSLSVIVRDIPQFAAVVLQLIFFLTPIIYPIESLPDEFRFLFAINPLAALIQAFRDLIVYARPPDPTTLYYPLGFALALLIFGYTLFKSIEDRMADG